MNILLTNDDGINSPGLWAMAETLSDLGNVTVIVPDRDQSGKGASMTLARVCAMLDTRLEARACDSPNLGWAFPDCWPCLQRLASFLRSLLVGPVILAHRIS